MELWVLDLLLYISLAAILIPIILIFSTFNSQPPEYKWLAVILLLSFSCDVVAEILYRLRLPVNFAGVFWTVFGPVTSFIFFYYAIGWKKFKIPFTLIAASYFLFAVINFLFFQKIDINTYSNIISKLMIMVLSILYYYKLLRDLPSENIQRVGLFWIISALFFGNAAKLVFFSFAQYLISIFKDNLILLWSMHNFISIVENLIIGYGAYLQHTQLKRNGAKI